MKLRYHTPGEVVGAGKTVMEIVPLQENLLIPAAPRQYGARLPGVLIGVRECGPCFPLCSRAGNMRVSLDSSPKYAIVNR